MVCDGAASGLAGAGGWAQNGDMTAIGERPPPDDSLIAPFGKAPGHYADAFTTELDAPISLQDLITAFYTSPLFRAEHLVLRLAGRGGAAGELDALAAGQGARFAAWSVQARKDGEMLLADV